MIECKKYSEGVCSDVNSEERVDLLMYGEEQQAHVALLEKQSHINSVPINSSRKGECSEYNTLYSYNQDQMFLMVSHLYF